jgi:hypothetical protein
VTTLVCTSCGEPWQKPGRPEPRDQLCGCGGLRKTPMMAKRTELKRVSDARMEAEGDKLLKRESTLRSRRRKKLSLAEFHQAVTDDDTSGCALAYDGGCWGGLQAHHFVPQQRIKRAGLSEKDLACALTDPRNGVPLCHFHHGQVEAARLESPRPLDLDEFLEEYGITEQGRLAA